MKLVPTLIILMFFLNSVSIAWGADCCINLWSDFGSALYFRNRGFVADLIGIRVGTNPCMDGIIRDTRPVDHSWWFFHPKCVNCL